ncbi:MAG TPA: FxLYD domain-containing protein [Candidatus Binataceae bacterium]|nr:FxLYD domain-containing protein [Candidatus Binataceae bacterium]
MTKHIALAALLALAVAAPAAADSGGVITPQNSPSATAPLHQKRLSAVERQRQRLDHPKTTVAPNSDLDVKITFDQVLRSCCAPANLVVSGTMKNVTDRPIDYVKVYLTFEDHDGQVVYAEGVYNKKAISLEDDAMAEKIYNEKPHFVPIPPGGSDEFTVSALMPWVPPYSKIELISVPTQGESALRVGSR